PVGTKQEVFAFIEEYLPGYTSRRAEPVVDSGYLIPIITTLGVWGVAGSALILWSKNMAGVPWWMWLASVVTVLIGYAILQHRIQCACWSQVDRTWKIRRGLIPYKYWYVPRQNLISVSKTKIPVAPTVAAHSFRIGGTMPKTVYGW